MSFSDMLIQLDQHRKLYTTLYNKPTDSHSFLHFCPCHPHCQKTTTQGQTHMYPKCWFWEKFSKYLRTLWQQRLPCICPADFSGQSHNYPEIKPLHNYWSWWASNWASFAMYHNIPSPKPSNQGHSQTELAHTSHWSQSTMCLWWDTCFWT